MSYLITVKYPPTVQAEAAEKQLRDQQVDRLKGITEKGREFGCIHHTFTEDTDGAVMVVDEWSDEDGFRRFFADQAQEINQVTAAMGGDPGIEPDVTIRRIMDTPDRF